MTDEVIDAYPSGRFTHERVSFITDDILAQRYVEIEGHLEKVLSVVKMRGSEHATDFRTYRLTSAGAVMGESLSDYRGITTGVPELIGTPAAVGPDG
jgi:circadian clock protein KaiC